MRIQLPSVNPVDLASFDGVTLKLCCPLTPTQNVYDRLHKYQQLEIRNTSFPILRDQAHRALGKRPEIWAPQIDLRIVRCSTAHVATDQHNVLGGCKQVIDLLQRPKVVHDKKRRKSRHFPGIGLVDDDRNIHVKSVEDRTKKNWNLPGPGTWFFIRKRRSTLPKDKILDALDDYAAETAKHRRDLKYLCEDFALGSLEQYLCTLLETEEEIKRLVELIEKTDQFDKEVK